MKQLLLPFLLGAFSFGMSVATPPRLPSAADRGIPVANIQVENVRSSGNDTRTQLRFGGGAKPKDKDCLQVFWPATWPRHPPLLVNATLKEFILPTGTPKERQVSVSYQGDVHVSCPGSRLTLTDTQSATATCRNGKFKIPKIRKYITLDELKCAGQPKAEVVMREEGTCAGDGVLHVIGWRVSVDMFVPQITVCFHKSSETTSYTFHEVYGRSMAAKTVDPGRPSFKMECRFSVPMTTIYSKNSQVALMKNLLGSSEVIQPKKQLYFAKGHLAPDSDFVYASHQDATYYFINAVPQWQAFNNGNWKAMEFSIRDLAIAHNSTLKVWTGTWGTLTLRDTNNNDVPIFLGETVGKKLVPAPRLMWKVVLEEDTGRAVALVGLNNPYATALEKPDRLCADICDQISWVDWPRENFGSGYMYCCRVADLHAKVPYAPALANATLLSE